MRQLRTNLLGYDLGLVSRSATPTFQIFTKLNGATKTIDVASEWTQSDVKAALSDKIGHFLGDECYLVAPGGKAMNGGDVTTMGQLGVGKGGHLELRYRARGGGGVLARFSCCGVEKAEAEAKAAPTSDPASAAGQSADVTTLGQAAYTFEPPPQHLTPFSSIPSPRASTTAALPLHKPRTHNAASTQQRFPKS